MDHAKPAEADKDIQDRILNFLLLQQQAYAVWGVLFDPDWPRDENPRTYGRMATPIYYASLAGLLYTVEMLLAKGANVNAQGGHYGNALQAASAGGHHEIVQLLLEKGANELRA
ncbi:Pfs, NACHT and ankyrin domain protein [Aspergillus udagawae]|nr:Pfs, NACHT and ankyrin domain protein [Aspergillus udagawae]